MQIVRICDRRVALFRKLFFSHLFDVNWEESILRYLRCELMYLVHNMVESEFFNWLECCFYENNKSFDMFRCKTCEGRPCYCAQILALI